MSVENSDIPIELSKEPEKVVWFKRANVKMKMEAKLTEKHSILIFYTNENRILISSTRDRRGIINEEEHFSGKMMKYDRDPQKLVKGMSADNFFKTANEDCKKCQHSYVYITDDDRRIIACTECWINSMSHLPETERIQWVEFDCKSHYLNIKDKVWKHGKNNKNLSVVGYYLQTDYFVKSEKTLHPCTIPTCNRFAMGTINNYCQFPCCCGRASVVVSCCDKWHPPIPCRLLKRWTTLRDLIHCDDFSNRKKKAHTVVQWISEEGGDGERPEIFENNGEVEYTDEFESVYKRYNDMLYASFDDEEKARKRMKSNLKLWNRNYGNLDVDSNFLQQGISTLTKSRHFLMYIYIYMFYLKDPNASGVSDRELMNFKTSVISLSKKLRKDLAAEKTFGFGETEWWDDISTATEELREDRKKLLAKIMENNNFNFKV